MQDEQDPDDAMRRESLDGSADRRIAALAERQHGVVSRAQVVALGVHPRAIDRRVAAGRLHRLHVGVYAVGHRALSDLGRVMAAVLASGPAAVVSHRSAAALHGIRGYVGSPEVTARPGSRGRPGIRLTQASLRPDEVTVVKGIPATSVSRTLLDLGTVLDGRGVEKAIREAEYLALFDLEQVSLLVDRYPQRRGTARLRAAARAAADSEVRTRSELEEAFRRLVLAAKLPEPEMNATLELGELTIEADAVWRDAKLIVELDGRQAHGTRAAFETDRERDRHAALAGWTVIRLTWRQVNDQRPRITRDLRRLIERRSN